MTKKLTILLKRSWTIIKEFFLDLLFPKVCVGCFEEGSWICAECMTKIIKVESQVCPQCSRLSEGGKYCETCSKDKKLKGVTSSVYFEEGPIREAIHNFKYNGVKELAPILAKMMTRSLQENFKYQSSNIEDSDKKEKKLEIRNSNLIITYVPLHWLRMARRGYNQSELLAQEIGKELSIPVERLLIKRIRTKRQAELSGKKRRQNLQNVFRTRRLSFPGHFNGYVETRHAVILLLVRGCISLFQDLILDYFKKDFYKPIKTNHLHGKTIILVDDVNTTGATLNECAAVLKQAGAKEVWGLVIARG